MSSPKAQDQGGPAHLAFCRSVPGAARDYGECDCFINVTIERGPFSGWYAYIVGRSAAILRPVPGNTHPASPAYWSTPEEAVAELPSLLGRPVRAVVKP